jgi:hypothetical protein
MIELLQRNYRRVKIGGRKLGPLHTGRYYTVGPLTIERWFSLYGMVCFLNGGPPNDWQKFVAEKGNALVVSLPLLVLEPLRDSDYNRCAQAQTQAVLKALGEVNNIPYLLEQSKPGKGESVDALDVIDALCQMRPAYDHDKARLLPAQALFAILEAVGRNERRRGWSSEPKEVRAAEALELAKEQGQLDGGNGV